MVISVTKNLKLLGRRTVRTMNEDTFISDPWKAIADALAYPAQNKEIPEDVNDRAGIAAMALVAQALVETGMPEDKAIDTVSRDAVVHIKYHPEVGLMLDVDWTDGTASQVTQ